MKKDNIRSSNVALYSTRFDDTLNMLRCLIETNIEATIGAQFASALDLVYAVEKIDLNNKNSRKMK